MEISLPIPQIIVICVAFYTLFDSLVNHRQKRWQEEIPYDAEIDCLSFCILTGILYWGGFFIHFGWPQIIYFFFIFLLHAKSCVFHGEIRFEECFEEINFWPVLFMWFLILIFLYWGGFFNLPIQLFFS